MMADLNNIFNFNQMEARSLDGQQLQKNTFEGICGGHSNRAREEIRTCKGFNFRITVLITVR